MLEKLGFQQLIEETLTIKRRTRSMAVFRFIRGMILACYVGFSRLNQFRFLKRDPMLTGILEVAELPRRQMQSHKAALSAWYVLGMEIAIDRVTQTPSDTKL
jgi:hypothetical protein